MPGFARWADAHAHRQTAAWSRATSPSTTSDTSPWSAARTVDLSAREFALLGFFIRHAGQVVTRQQILDQVWGAEPDVYSNVVDLYVSYLRRKLGELDRASRLQTVRGVGYTLKAEG